jgi:hypothetical protein
MRQQFLGAHRQGDDAQFEVAAAYVLGDLAAACLLELEVHLRVVSLVGGDGRRQNEGHGGGAATDAHSAALQPLVQADLLFQVLPAGEQAAPGGQCQPAFLGEFDAVAVAHQQARTQLFLVLLDTPRQRRLGQPQAVGGAGNGTGFGDGQERAGQLEVHVMQK